MSINEYLDWRGDLTFEASPFNEIDSIILTQIPYLDWTGILTSGETTNIKDAFKSYYEIHRNDQRTETIYDQLLTKRERLIGKLCKTERFKDIELLKYVVESSSQEETQFAAITIKLTDGTFYVCYEGTDDTLFGWKENFNMSFMKEIPSQKLAAQYLQEVLEEHPLNKFRVGGHSKGGNLAVYASVMLEDDERILQVYNVDGPGFDKEFVESEQYQKTQSKVITYMPQGSVVGRMLNNDTKIVIVKAETDNIAFQHDALIWQVMGTKLVSANNFTNTSEFLNVAIQTWFEELTYQQKEVFIDVVYAALIEADVRTPEQLRTRVAPIMASVTSKLVTVDEGTRGLILKVLQCLIQSGTSAFKEVYIDKTIDMILELPNKSDK